MASNEHPSVSVVCQPIGSGVTEIGVRGILTQAGLRAALIEAMPSMNMADACVVRLDLALFAMAQLPMSNLAIYHGSSTPSALIVQPAAFDFWQAWAAVLAREIGLVRAVFLSQHRTLGYQWAADHAAARRAELPPSRQSPRRPYHAGRSAGRTIGRSAAPLM